MGILVITWNFPPKLGGMESLIAGLCKELRKNHPLFVIASYAASDGAHEEWIFRPRWPGLPAFSLYALSRGALLLWRNPDIRVIIGGSAMVTPLLLILARFFRRKAMVNVHGLDLVYHSALYQFLCVRWIKHCDGIIANSHFTASLARAKKIPERSIRVIPPGVDCGGDLSSQGSQAKKDLGFDGRKVLLYVGRLTRRKGVKEFMERSLPAVIAEVPEACFVIVGDNATDSMVHRDDVASEIRAALKASPPGDHVRLLGALEGHELARAYAASDLLVLPVIPIEDDVEGFGMVLLEGAAAGKPCVATRAGGIPDAVQDGKSGILVAAGDYESMSRAILELLRDEALRQSMGRYAQRRARAQFAWPSIVARYEEMLSSLTADRP
jgi:phosphatidylinositol alpha-1,6-mannosyltransferase